MIRRTDVLLAAGAAAVAVLAAVAVAVAGTPNQSRPGPAGTAEPVRPASALFIGDSVTDTTSLAEMSYACRAAVQMRWQCSVSAVPGTGYISGGPSNRFSVDDNTGTSTSFSERIPKLATEYSPDVVILDGGRNDLFPPAADVGKAMTYTLGEARRAWPQATIVFVRPRYLAHPDDNLGFDDGFMAQLESDPAAAGVVFVDPIADARFHGDTSNLIGPDGQHQNAVGDQQLADALVTALRARGIEVAS